MADSFGTSPQFDTAQYTSQSATSCGICGVPLKASYYRVNGKMACANCAQRIESSLPKDSGKVFLKSLMFGLAGLAIGMALYSAVEILTSFTIGYLALAVGYIVAKLMMVGSGGIGGRKYQVAALLLTYFAISVSAIPVYIAQRIKEKKIAHAAVKPYSATAPATSTAQPPAVGQQQAAVTPPSAQAQDPAAAAQPVAKPAVKKLGAREFALGIGVLILIGLASPFLELMSPASGIIGLIILAVGLQIAWKVAAGAKRATVEGPYTV